MLTTYEETINYLYNKLPVYQHIGPKAYKNDLTNTIALCHHLGNPESKFKSVHVAGTNGKGSSSHMLAAVLQSAGYKTGLYTSPHLKDFTERIKINGKEIDKKFVVDFTNDMMDAMDKIQPSFFELTMVMAFEYFVRQKIDIAVIEVGLGGRLDSTNVITPEVSLITNIGYDHMDILGNTLPEIAKEKAGIIKPNIPVVISETQPEVESVFVSKAHEANSTICFASDKVKVIKQQNSYSVECDKNSITINPELKGIYQEKNIAGVIQTINELVKLGWKIDYKQIIEGINHTVTLTGLKGRWQKIHDDPTVIADTAHNAEGITELIKQTPHKNLRWVFGIVKDKSPDKVFSLLPKSAHYYFCQAKIPRAMDANELSRLGSKYNLNGIVVADVNDALDRAISQSEVDDLIMVGGSNFVVGELHNL